MANYLHVAKKIARKAGSLIKASYDSFERQHVVYKKYNETVTAVDKKADMIIISEIRKHWPAHSILSEESKPIEKKSDYQWFVDPLDGTFNYIIKVPFFCTVIALAFKREIVMSVVYDPITNNLYWAEKGKGAYCNGVKMNVSKNKNFAHSLNSFSYGKTRAIAKRMSELYYQFRSRHISLRHPGSSALEAIMVAKGITDTALTYGFSPWDNAAVGIFVIEAGGSVTDWNGRPWSLRSTSMLATNGLLHKKMQEAVRTK